jgi:hypothetical protein
LRLLQPQTLQELQQSELLPQLPPQLGLCFPAALAAVVVVLRLPASLQVHL